MNPNEIVHIGPLAIALDRLAALALILLFLGGMEAVLRRLGTAHQRQAAQSISGLALLAGIVAARAAYVWAHRDSFALDPAAALYVWLGGWVWTAGVVSTGLVLIVMLRNARALVPALGLLGALTAAWAFAEKPGSHAPILLPADLPFIMAQDGRITAGELRGKPLVLNLWATWCPPCRREMPMLIDAANGENRARIVLVNQGEAAEQVGTYLQAQGMSAQHVAYDPQGILGTLTASTALPTTLFVAPDGTIRHIHAGEISRVQLDIMIRKIAPTDSL